MKNRRLQYKLGRGLGGGGWGRGERHKVGKEGSEGKREGGLYLYLKLCLVV